MRLSLGNSKGIPSDTDQHGSSSSVISMTVEWKKRIAIAFLVKQRIGELDQGRLWDLHYPELAATEEQLSAVEAHLGFSLPGQYRQFLECASGWQCFFLNVDLFGVEDLLG